MHRKNRIIPYRRALKQLARNLRKRSTPAEIALWMQLKSRLLGVEFHRQVPIDQFIVDFYCHELTLAIEIDGGSHDHPDQYEADVIRQKRLESFGIQFLRFAERDVIANLSGVVDTIRLAVEALKGK